MKRHFLLLLAFPSTLFADLERTAIEFATALIKQHPELDYAENIEYSVEDFIDALKKNQDFFFIDGEEMKQIRADENIIQQSRFQQVYTVFSKLAPNKPETQFITAKLESTDISTKEQFFLYRYMRYQIPDLIHPNITKSSSNPSSGTIGSSQIEQVFTIFLQKKEQLGWIPSFEELDLPSHLFLYTDPETEKRLPWLYVADIKSSSYNTPHPILAIPVPSSTGRVRAIREDGSIIASFGFKKMESLNTNKTTLADLEALEQKEAETAHLPVLVEGAKAIIQRHQARERALTEGRLKEQAESNDISLLRFKKGQENYITADQSQTYHWIYVGATHRVTSDGERIICLTSTPVLGSNHLGFFEDGTHIEISEIQYNAILKDGIH